MTKAVTKRTGKTGPVTITPAGLALVRKRAADGVALSTIAKALRIDPKTFRTMRKADETLADAVETGRAAMETELVGILMAQARKGGAGAIVPCLFILKSMRGFVEGKPPEGSGGATVNITIPAAMSKEEFSKIVEVEAVEVEATETQRVIRG